MKIDTTGFRDKASKRPEELRLYEEHDDYIAAYAAHTDLRVRRDGPHQAIGGRWEEHGPVQLAFLQEHGLGPHSRLLDFGCGTGRLARHAVPYLAPGNYFGVDISPAALDHLRTLAVAEDWTKKNPSVVLGDGTFSCVAGWTFNVVWAHSVFTHLPADRIDACFDTLRDVRFERFLFTYKRADEPVRTGLKQFAYPPEFLAERAKVYGFRASEVGYTFMSGQHTMEVTR